MTLEKKLQEARQKAIEEALERAKAEGARIMHEAKRKGIGLTTIQDDIYIINQIIDQIGKEIKSLTDTDAKPLLILKSITWDNFKDLFPNKAQGLVNHIEHRDKKKLRTEQEIDIQIKSCFSLAHELLEKELKPIIKNWQNAVVLEHKQHTSRQPHRKSDGWKRE